MANTLFRALSCCDGLPGRISLDHPSSCPLKPSQLPPASSVTLFTWQQDASGMRTSHLLLNAFPRLAWTPGSSMVVCRALRHLAATCCLSSLAPQAPSGVLKCQHPPVTSGAGPCYLGGGALCAHCSHWPCLLSSGRLLHSPTPLVFPPPRRRL